MLHDWSLNSFYKLVASLGSRSLQIFSQACGPRACKSSPSSALVPVHDSSKGIYLSSRVAVKARRNLNLCLCNIDGQHIVCGHIVFMT